MFIGFLFSLCGKGILVTYRNELPDESEKEFDIQVRRFFTTKISFLQIIIHLQIQFSMLHDPIFLNLKTNYLFLDSLLTYW